MKYLIFSIVVFSGCASSRIHPPAPINSAPRLQHDVEERQKGYDLGFENGFKTGIRAANMNVPRCLKYGSKQNTQ